MAAGEGSHTPRRSPQNCRRLHARSQLIVGHQAGFRFLFQGRRGAPPSSSTLPQPNRRLRRTGLPRDATATIGVACAKRQTTKSMPAAPAAPCAAAASHQQPVEARPDAVVCCCLDHLLVSRPLPMYSSRPPSGLGAVLAGSAAPAVGSGAIADAAASAGGCAMAELMHSLTSCTA